VRHFETGVRTAFNADTGKQSLRLARVD